MGKERKFLKKGYRAHLKRSAEAMREVNKTKKIHKTSQNPVVGSTDIQHVKMENDNLECKIIKEEIDIVFEPEEIEETVEGDDTMKNNNASGSDIPCKTESNEELWVVRRQLCRGCHSEGTFCSLQTATEGDTYGDLLQTYFNIQLCPVSKDELALSAICSLCAARLRDARAFSAQAHAAEERFTLFYKQNRVRALVNEVEIKEDAPKIKIEVDDFKITVDVEPGPANLNLDNPESGKDKLAPTLKKNKKKQKGSRKAAPKKFNPAFRLLPSDYERVGNLFKCTRCDKVFKKGMISKHVKHTHLKLPRHKFTCTHCDKTFNDISPFTRHKLEEHSIDDRIKCNACDWFTYGNYSILTKHKNSFHMLGKKLTCPDCDYICFSVNAIRRHVIKHSTVKEHHCKFCKKSFLRKHNLDFHERIHTGDKRKVCNECGQAFVQRASLTYHMAKHHPEVRF